MRDGRGEPCPYKRGMGDSDCGILAGAEAFFSGWSRCGYGCIYVRAEALTPLRESWIGERVVRGG